MRLDGIALILVVQELKRELVSARLQQVYQPEENLLTFDFYSGQEQRLLISAGPEPALFLTQARLRNPAHPPAFCMLLRKHLVGGRLLDIEQHGWERMVDLLFSCRSQKLTLRCELFGHNSNVVLLKESSALGALRRGSGEKVVLAAVPPTAPIPLDPAQKLWRALVDGLTGVGPQLARELAARAGLDSEQLAGALTATQLDALWQQVRALSRLIEENRWEPHLYYDQGQPVAAAPFPLRSLASLNAQSRESFNAALDEVFRAQQAEMETEKLAQALDTVIRGKLKKLREILNHIDRDLARARDHDRLREEADLLMAHLTDVPRGTREITLPEFTGDTTRKISLDPRLDALGNAQKRYERQKKLKRALEKLGARRDHIEADHRYWQEMQVYLEQSENLDDLRALAAELAEQRATEERPKPKQQREPRAAGPRVFWVDGIKVLVGRSSRQNDELVRGAAGQDLWLHARDRPGSHVVIKTDNHPERVPSAVLHKAAQLAAHYSQGRGAAKVPVTYALVKHLRKPKGAKPGAVVLMKEEGTLLVQPSLDL